MRAKTLSRNIRWKRALRASFRREMAVHTARITALSAQIAFDEYVENACDAFDAFITAMRRAVS